MSFFVAMNKNNDKQYKEDSRIVKSQKPPMAIFSVAYVSKYKLGTLCICYLTLFIQLHITRIDRSAQKS